jgi:hypothetical protein
VWHVVSGATTAPELNSEFNNEERVMSGNNRQSFKRHGDRYAVCWTMACHHQQGGDGSCLEPPYGQRQLGYIYIFFHGYGRHYISYSVHICGFPVNLPCLTEIDYKSLASEYPDTAYIQVLWESI